MNMQTSAHNLTGHSYRFRNFVIGARMMEGINRYIDHRIKPGNFLCAVIQNDLRGAVESADPESLVNLPAFVAYFYNIAPEDCWGSKEKFDNWLENKTNGQPAESSASTDVDNGNATADTAEN